MTVRQPHATNKGIRRFDASLRATCVVQPAWPGAEASVTPLATLRFAPAGFVQ